MNITRGFSRKINLGNYETADFWAEYEGEEDSNALYQHAKEDVECAIKEFFGQLEADTPDDIPLEEWEQMSPGEQVHHQEIKKARSRIKYHKDQINKLKK